MEGENKVFLRADLQEAYRLNGDFKKLIDDFKAHLNGKYISYFGRKAPFHRPRPDAELAELMHIHILSRSPHAAGLGAARVRDAYGRKSDSFLIYSTGFFNPNCHYVIDYLENSAHSKVEDMDYMRWLINKAEEFRKKM